MPAAFPPIPEDETIPDVDSDAAVYFFRYTEVVSDGNFRAILSSGDYDLLHGRLTAVDPIDAVQFTSDGSTNGRSISFGAAGYSTDSVELPTFSNVHQVMARSSTSTFNDITGEFWIVSRSGAPAGDVVIEMGPY